MRRSNSTVMLVSLKAVAIAGLAVTMISKGTLDAKDASRGMIAGSAGMAACAAAAVVLLKRVPPFVASAASLAVWGAVAGEWRSPFYE